MLLVAGIMSIIEFSSISSSVQKLLDDNYKSVNASKEMIEALEREDSGILMLLLGQWDEGRYTLTSADSVFLKAFAVAKTNITIENEAMLVENVEERYTIFKDKWEKPIVGTEKQGNINWYTHEVHPAFIDAKAAVKELMTLNDKTMYHTSMSLKNRSRRAIMPGIVAIISAILFAFMFNFFVNLYVVNPIVSLTNGIKNYLQYGKKIRTEVETNDELVELSNSVISLINRSS